MRACAKSRPVTARHGDQWVNVAKCNLGKVKFKTMPVSGCPTSQLRGDLLSSLLGVPRDLHHICLLAGLCERLFCSLIFKPFFPLYPPFGKYRVW